VAKNSEANASLGLPSQQRRAVWIITAAWSAAIFAIALWWMQDRLLDHREHAVTTATVRLNGVKEALAINLRQLAALPVDLAHRPGVPDFVAGRDKPDPIAQDTDIQQMLDRVGADFGLPLITLLDRSGYIVASSNGGVRGLMGPNGTNLSSREYFRAALANGQAMQFLLGLATRAPGLYFASRISRNGVPGWGSRSSSRTPSP